MIINEAPPPAKQMHCIYFPLDGSRLYLWRSLKGSSFEFRNLDGWWLTARRIMRGKWVVTQDNMDQVYAGILGK